MADKVTIEGSITPSVLLARGERRTVARTARIDRLIARGFVVEVPEKEATPEPETDESEGQTTPPPSEPKGNASRDEWAAHLDSQSPKIEYPEDAGRDDLIRIWQAHLQG
ncbi:hypothetical protein SEA_EVAA_22 [Gordonia phage Evaa]|nr:hypothetical protein SEA_EVAA_22 [Gordonia phage Evaa]